MKNTSEYNLAAERLSAQKIARQLMTVLLLATFVSACTKFEYHETVDVPINKLSDEEEAVIDEELFLDVGVVLFHHGVDELDDEQAAYANVRKSEAVWYTSQLKNTLDRSNAWGLVRALPQEEAGRMDVIVSGVLVNSNGESVTLSVKAQDSSGRVWFDKEYEQRVSQYAYNPEVNLPGDPFQAMFNNIANDLFNHRAGLSDQELLNVRSTTKVLFARDFIPAAFDSYVQTDENGISRLARIPANDDPFIKKVDRIRARNDLFLDVIQDYYRAFNNNMSAPYQEWRKLSYKEVLLERQLREQARKEKIAGVVAIAGGVAASTSGNNRATRVGGLLGSIYGAQVFAGSFLKSDQALSHSETLREMGTSLELELEPSVVSLQDRSVTLSGTVEDQFVEWRRILSRMFELEEGGVDSTEDDPDTLDDNTQASVNNDQAGIKN